MCFLVGFLLSKSSLIDRHVAGKLPLLVDITGLQTASITPFLDAVGKQKVVWVRCFL